MATTCSVSCQYEKATRLFLQLKYLKEHRVALIQQVHNAEQYDDI